MREDELDRRLHTAAQRLRERGELQPVPALPARARAARLRPRLVQVVAVLATIVVVVLVGLGGRLLLARKQSEPALSGTHPVAVAYGLGAVWVADKAGGELVEVDPATLAVRGRSPICPDPVDVTVAGDSVWVLCGGDGTLRGYHPGTGRTDRVATSFDPVALGSSATGLLVLSGGNQTLEVRDSADGHLVHAVTLGAYQQLFAANQDSAVLARGNYLMAAQLTDAQSHVLVTLRADVDVLALTDGGTVLAATADGRLSVVTGDGQVRSSVALPGPPVALAVHDQTVWASTVDGSLVQFQIAGTALTAVRVTHPGTTITDLAVLADGSVVGICATAPFLVREREQP